MSFPTTLLLLVLKKTGQQSAYKEAMVPVLPGEGSLESLLIINSRKQ